MAERIGTLARWSRIKRALKSGSLGEKGQVACLDLSDGSLVPASVATTLLPIGRFEHTFTGDGATLMSVALFQEIELMLMSNQATGTVADDDVGSLCYLHSSQSEVSMTSTGKSLAGRVWGLDGTTGVWVQLMPAMGPQGPAGS